VATVKQVEPRPTAPGGGAGTSLHKEARRAQRRRRLGSTGRHAALAFATLVFVVPFYFVILASVKNSNQIFSYPPKLLPFPLYFGNFKELLSQTQFLRWLLNTLIVAGSVAAIKVLIDSMAGYALAKLQITGKRIIFIFMLILLMVPLSALIVPLWTLVRMLGLLDTYWALILPALANPLGVFLMRQFILGLPSDLMNAARLDGMSEFSIYWRIVLPLVKPGLVVLAVIIFTDQYISFIWPLIATTSNNMELLTVGVANLHARGGVNFGLWSASAVMSLVPIAIVFFALQRQFMSRSLTGALKQ
jgi:ABC-type glycerol-3-phosphate transport system permease component